MKVKEFIVNFLGDKETYNIIKEAVDIYLELVNIVINILYIKKLWLLVENGLF